MGKKLPRDKSGTKKHSFPARAPKPMKHGLAEGHRSVIGKTLDGFVQSRYHIRLGEAPVRHERKTGKPYVQVHHGWYSGSRDKPKALGKGFSLADMDKPEIFRVTPRGRKWASECALVKRYPKADD